MKGTGSNPYDVPFVLGIGHGQGKYNVLVGVGASQDKVLSSSTPRTNRAIRLYDVPNDSNVAAGIWIELMRFGKE